MNITTLIGILMGIGLVSGAIYYEMGSFIYFINLSGLMIVLGGTAASTFISFPTNDVFNIFRSVYIVLKREPPRLQEYIDHIIHLVHVAKRGTNKDLEREVPLIDNLFLRDGVQMLADGYSAVEITEILDERIAYKMEREAAEAEVLKTMARMAPAFGMIGTLIGLIMLLSNLTDTGLDHLGAGLSVALLTTFYGVLFSNLLLKPFAYKIERRTDEAVIGMRMIKESILMISERWHPVKVQDYLNSFLKPADRRIPNRYEFQTEID